MVSDCRSTARTCATICRRQLLESSAAASLVAALAPLPAAAKGLKGFSTLRDTGDGYEFAYPFGWQEVSVQGVEAVYEDVIEPLESVSVQLVATDKKSIVDYGPPNEIAGTLANSVLSNPNDEIQLVKSEPEKDGDRCDSCVSNCASESCIALLRKGRHACMKQYTSVTRVMWSRSTLPAN